MTTAVDEGFTTFVREATPALTRTAWLLTGDQHNAADLVQQALIKTFRVWPELDTPRALAYARKAIATTNIDNWRRRHGEVPVAQVYDRASSDSMEDRVAARDRVARMLDTLPARQRTIVVLRYYEDLPEQQIADHLGMSAGAVRSALHRALTSLRSHYPDAAFEGDPR